MNREIMQFFQWDHLKSSELQEVSKLFGELAQKLDAQFPEGNAEVSAGLRKLLEAKDCFVRAAILKLPKYEEVK